MVLQARRMDFEQEQERVAKELPDMRYISKWKYWQGTEKNENGKELAKNSSLELNLELPSSYENWEGMRRLLIENGLPVTNAKKNRFFCEGITFHSNVGYGNNSTRTYNLYIYRKGMENLRERLRLKMSCRVDLGEEVVWDFALIKSVAAYVRAYEESLKPKAKVEPKVEIKPEVKEVPKNDGQAEESSGKSNLVSIVAG